MVDQQPSYAGWTQSAVAEAEGFALFETAIGTCGVAWSERGIVRILLPGESDDAVRTRLARELPASHEQEPPPAVAEAVVRMRALMAGEQDDLADVQLDWSGVSDFHRRVYEIARAIEPGSTLTYGEVAHRLDDPGAAQAVGQALGRNPFPIVVPCHRVLAAGGKSGGFSAPGGAKTKLRMLVIEGAREPDPPTLFDV
ncbi:methylated-DNA--[protein]-cysteine S-methyltransferase [Luteipulveratus mongoliensis]|uniref:methylated-DNA--[protein]-cysteine S-methyltransferase n=1 Tax=Luteipulveratus mongoliensis TaxID=571913 RepID=A0A0K1JGN8_9MICO|nr:methylated-DNA--[protein]-cysteine S-methyltransferase [Luteipulveratus mongoliensis]AKU15887.1 cysteine methyltransferase [Luteipulveratus mongoliensis]